MTIICWKTQILIYVRGFSSKKKIYASFSLRVKTINNLKNSSIFSWAISALSRNSVKWLPQTKFQSSKFCQTRSACMQRVCIAFFSSWAELTKKKSRMGFSLPITANGGTECFKTIRAVQESIIRDRTQWIRISQWLIIPQLQLSPLATKRGTKLRTTSFQSLR